MRTIRPTTRRPGCSTTLTDTTLATDTLNAGRASPFRPSGAFGQAELATDEVVLGGLGGGEVDLGMREAGAGVRHRGPENQSETVHRPSS
jgi:hypothetical protein